MSETGPAPGEKAGEGAPPPSSPPPSVPPEPPPAPSPRVRRGFKIAIVAALGLALVLAAGATAALRHTHTNAFCIDCHHEPGRIWSTSPHKNVECRTCHPADLFEEARLGYAAYIERKTEVGEHRPMDAGICASCHIGKGFRWPEISATPGHARHVAQKGLNCLECHVTSVHVFQADVSQCRRCHDARASSQRFVGAGGGAGEPVATYGGAGAPPGREALPSAALLLEARTAVAADAASHAKAPIGKLEAAHCLDCHDFLGRRENTLRPTAATCRACHAPLDRLGAAALLAAVEAGTVPAAPSRTAATAPREGRPIWTPRGHDDCLGCHRPHGRPVAYPQDCLACHAKLLEPGNRHLKDERLNACALCHAPHDPRPRQPLIDAARGGDGK